jgi:hypothetical protein
VSDRRVKEWNMIEKRKERKKGLSDREDEEGGV